MLALSNKKHLIPILLTLALVVAVYVYIKTRPNEPTPTSIVNLNPPTEEELRQAEDNKVRIVKNQDQQTNQPSSSLPKNVTPVISNTEQYNNGVEISGFVPGIFEDGGTCTATLSKGNSKVTKQSSGFKNVSNTQCNVLRIPASELSAGTWDVILSYSSSTAQGSSVSKTVMVN